MSNVHCTYYYIPISGIYGERGLNGNFFTAMRISDNYFNGYKNNNHSSTLYPLTIYYKIVLLLYFFLFE